VLGVYVNFPENAHKTATFTIAIKNKQLQQILIRFLKETNNKAYKLEEITIPTIPECSVIFECGIAETNNFIYLDDEETNKILNIAKKTPFKIMDFYYVLKYYRMQNYKKTPLKFDYYMIRTIFDKNLRLQVFHERGPRYVSPEDLIHFIADGTNKMSSKKILRIMDNG